MSPQGPRRCRQRGWLLVALSSCAPVALAQVAFSPPVAYSTGSGSQPQTVVMRDVNGDGQLDVLTANLSHNTVSVLLGTTPRGTLSARTDYATGTSPFGLAVGDVNGDGRLDLVTTNLSANTVSVLLGSATAPGTFAAPSDYATGSSPRVLALGDVNGDNRLDIVTANYAGNSVSLLLGNALVPGSFPLHTEYATGAGTQGLALGDLNGDSKLDVVSTNVTANSLSVLLNTGSTVGAFAPAVDYAVGLASDPVSVAVGDVNGDSRLDVVSANFAGNAVSVLLGSPAGTGSLLPPVAYATGANSTPTWLALGDLDGDGRLDVVSANTATGSVSVLLGAGTPGGTFNPYTSYALGTNPTGVALGDLNGDGRLDLVTSNQSTVSVLLNAAIPLALAKATAPATLRVFPNPAHGEFTLVVPALAGVARGEVELRDVLGQLVRRVSTEVPAAGLHLRWDTHGLAAGVYALQFQAGAVLLTTRVVVW